VKQDNSSNQAQICQHIALITESLNQPQDKYIQGKDQLLRFIPVPNCAVHFLSILSEAIKEQISKI
jgi:hypothetical protein